MPDSGFTNSAGRVSVYDQTLSTNYTTGVWQSCPLWAYQFDPSIGVLYEDGFTSYDAAATTGDWTLTQATTGTAAISTTVPGTLLVDAGATTDNQGANLQNLKAAFVPAANKSIWAEFCVTLTATTPPVTKAQLFVGLAASDTTIIAAGAMTTNNRIGWMILDGGLLVTTFTCDKAGTATTKTGPTLVDATRIRLGFVYDGAADTVQQYVNGATSGTAVVTANIPKLVIYPSLVCQSDATDRPNLLVHSIRVFQLR
jgi:hypothetical protein